MNEDNRSAREIYKNYRSHRRTTRYSRAREEERKSPSYGEVLFMQAVVSVLIGVLVYIAISGNTEIGEKISAKAEEILNESISIEQFKGIGETIVGTEDKKEDIEIDEEIAEKIRKDEKIYTDKIKNQ